MKNNVIEVRLWDKTVGLLMWDERKGSSVFQFDKNFKKYNLDISPVAAPFDSVFVQKGFPMSGNSERLYGGLPEFIADSLPDRWGNEVFQKWMKVHYRHNRQITAVDRLSFIGKRAMGALEFYPAHVEEDASVDIELESLYDLANKIFNERQNVSIDLGSGLVIEDLYKVGTSAGGQRPKAIIAINETSGVVRSGQAILPPEFKHYILKFDTGKPGDFPFTKVEMAYYLMARDAGIDMMPSKLVEINGTQNFLTERFDRVGGKKLHTQTLAAMSSLVDSYDDLFTVGRRIGLSAEDQQQQYSRMVFNVLAKNIDDHTKNFSFVMTPDGVWHLSPAYDLIFSVDPDVRFFRNHELSLGGKRKNIARDDMIALAERQNVKDAADVIDRISDVVSNFRRYAQMTGISDGWAKKIDNVLCEGLI